MDADNKKKRKREDDAPPKIIIRAKQVREFLSKPGKSLQEYLDALDETTRKILDNLCATKQETLFALLQGSEEWLAQRVGCCTASTSAAIVGHSIYDNALKLAREVNHPSASKSGPKSQACQWGIDNEKHARERYRRWLQRVVKKLYKKRTANFIVYNGHKIVVGEKCPIVKVLETGSIRDPVRKWKRVSPDGLVLFDGVACGIVEIKCPDAKFYLNIKVHYYDQLQSQLHVIRQEYKDVKWADFVVWSPTGFTVDMFEYDEEYQLKWYLPREDKFYFTLLLPEYVKWTLAAAAAPLTVKKESAQPDDPK